MLKNHIIFIFLVFFVFCSSISYADELKKGIDYYETGNYVAAEKFFKKLILNNPNNYSASYMLAASLVRLGKYQDASRYYNYVIANSQNENLVTLCRVGLQNLGETATSQPGQNITKALINVDTAGSVMRVNDVF